MSFTVTFTESLAVSSRKSYQEYWIAFNWVNHIMDRKPKGRDGFSVCVWCTCLCDVCTCVCWDHWLSSGIFHCFPPFFFLRQGLALNLEPTKSARSAGQWSARVLLSPSFLMMGFHVCCHIWLFHGCWEYKIQVLMFVRLCVFHWGIFPTTKDVFFVWTLRHLEPKEHTNGKKASLRCGRMNLPSEGPSSSNPEFHVWRALNVHESLNCSLWWQRAQGRHARCFMKF